MLMMSMEVVSSSEEFLFPARLFRKFNGEADAEAVPEEVLLGLRRLNKLSIVVDLWSQE
jgi:hypothetical protein